MVVKITGSREGIAGGKVREMEVEAERCMHESGSLDCGVCMQDGSRRRSQGRHYSAMHMNVEDEGINVILHFCLIMAPNCYLQPLLPKCTPSRPSKLPYYPWLP